MTRTADDVEGCRRAHVGLRSVVANLDEGAMHRPSLLDGWTVGHVLSHLAHNAEAMVRRVEAAQHGEQIDQYVGGSEGRAAAIDAGAGRPAAEVIEAVLAWSTRLDDTFASLPEEAWELQVRTVAGTTHAVALLPFRRWREVEVHVVDLDLGVTPDDWPQPFVERALPSLVESVRRRTDDRQLMAWILGRGDAPALDPWG